MNYYAASEALQQIVFQASDRTAGTHTISVTSSGSVWTYIDNLRLIARVNRFKCRPYRQNRWQGRLHTTQPEYTLYVFGDEKTQEKFVSRVWCLSLFVLQSAACEHNQALTPPFPHTTYALCHGCAGTDWDIGRSRLETCGGYS